MDMLRGDLSVEREEHGIRLLRKAREREGKVRNQQQQQQQQQQQKRARRLSSKGGALPLCFFLASCYYSASHIRALLRLLYALSGRSLLPRTHKTYIGVAQLAEIQRTRRCRIDLMAEEACFVL